MADVVVEASSSAKCGKSDGPRMVVIGPTSAYCFFLDSSSVLVYRKTTDGGDTWGATVTVGSFVCEKFGVWYDRWTFHPGPVAAAARNIHIVMIDGESDLQVAYRRLNTAGDVLSSRVIVFTPILLPPVNGKTLECKIVLSRVKVASDYPGVLYLAWSGGVDPTPEQFLASTDLGATWVTKATVLEDPARSDDIILVPNDKSGTTGCWAVYWDISADELSIKQYNSGTDAWSETVVETSMEERGPSTILEMAATSLPVDYEGAQGLAQATEFFWSGWRHLIGIPQPILKISLQKGLTEAAKTDVLSTPSANIVCLIFVRASGNLYAFYERGTGFTSGSIQHKRSLDEGTAWEAESDDSDGSTYNVEGLHGSQFIGQDGGFIRPCWFDLTTLQVLTLPAAVGDNGNGGKIPAATSCWRYRCRPNNELRRNHASQYGYNEIKEVH